jgi:integrase
LHCCALPGTPAGRRTLALIVVLWRSGLRISEALALEERDLDPAAGAITVRHGKGGKRRIVGMDPWGWAQIAGWLGERLSYPRGPVFCVVTGPTTGRHLAASAVRAELRQLAKRWHPTDCAASAAALPRR